MLLFCLNVCIDLRYTVNANRNINLKLIGYANVDYSDIVWASPVGVAPIMSSFST